MHGDVLVDGHLEIGHAGEYAAADALVGDIAQEPLDHIEPGRTGGREMDMKARVLVQPSQNLWVLVGHVVINDQVQLLGPERLAIDCFEKTAATPGADGVDRSWTAPCP